MPMSKSSRASLKPKPVSLEMSTSPPRLANLNDWFIACTVKMLSLLGRRLARSIRPTVASHLERLAAPATLTVCA